jgi:hypothetical protein
MAVYTFIVRAYFQDDAMLEEIEEALTTTFEDLHEDFYEYFQQGFMDPYGKVGGFQVHKQRMCLNFVLYFSLFRQMGTHFGICTKAARRLGHCGRRLLRRLSRSTQ